jgi:ABC-2 type transport system permease protein
LIQIGLWLVLLHFNQIDVQNTVNVLFLAGVVAGLNAVAAAVITTFLKDRERAQFIYSLTIVLVAGGSALIGRSPITLLTQLATNDYYASSVDVALYGGLLLLVAGRVLAFFKAAAGYKNLILTISPETQSFRGNLPPLSQTVFSRR